MLTNMLRNNEVFKSYPEEDQEIYLRLAYKFEESSNNLFLGPEELQKHLQLGNKEQWHTLLTMEPTQNFIQMAEITRIAQRKAFLALQEQAKGGNVQAVKEINELSGIMDKRDDNKIIVLHQIDRGGNK
jgi:hypothetical protein